MKALMVDVSNLQPALTPPVLDAMYTFGVRAVCVGLQYPSVATQQALGVGPGNAHLNFAALDADGRFLTPAYFESQPLGVVLRHVEATRLQACPFLAQAVEIEDRAWTKADLDAALAEIDGIRPDTWLYSSAIEWVQVGLAGEEYPGRNGWAAHYDERPNLDAPPFGGTTLAGKQYTCHGRIPGVPFEVDISVVELEEAVEYRTLGPSEAIEFVKKAAQAVGPDGGFIAEITGGYTPAPGNTAYLVEVKA